MKNNWPNIYHVEMKSFITFEMLDTLPDNPIVANKKESNYHESLTDFQDTDPVHPVQFNHI